MQTTMYIIQINIHKIVKKNFVWSKCYDLLL